MAKRIRQRSLFHKIVNGFVLLLAALVFILIVLLGFTQTKTFRELLRENIIALADSTINGKLYIERIDGSVISSVSLRNTVISDDSGTLFAAKNIQLSLSPHKLLFKKLFAREIIIDSISIALKEDQSGNWNIDRIFQSDTVEDSVDIDDISSDVPESEPAFPFIIQANDIQINDLDFERKSYSNLYSDTEIDSFDVDNLSISNLNLTASVLANISNNDYRLSIKNLSLDPNFYVFNLNKFSCDIRVTEKYADIADLTIQTDSSDLTLSARLDSINIFGDVDIEKFENYPLYIDLKADPFSFDDLTSFIKSTEILKGNVFVELSGLGTFGDISIIDFQVRLKDTFLDMSGDLGELHTPENLTLDVMIQNSSINYDNALSLLPSLDLPEFGSVMLSELDIDYVGRPTNFSTSMTGLINDTPVKLDGSLDLESDIMGYNINFQTDSLDLMPIISTATSLSTAGFIKGKGTAIEELDSEFEVTILGSYFDRYYIDSTKVSAVASNNLIDLDLNTIIDSSSSALNCQLNFTDPDLPLLILDGSVENLNLADILSDPIFESKINMELSANVRGDDLDYNSGNITTRFYNSRFDQLMFPSLNFSLSAVNTDKGRKIEVESDLIDLKLEGEYLISEVIDVISDESLEISKIFSGKFSEINPLDSSFSVKKELEEKFTVENEVIEKINLEYDFTIKENDLFEVFLQQDEINLAGSGSGSILNDSTNFTIDSRLFFDYLFINNNGEIIYFSDLEANLNFTQDNEVQTFNNLFGSVSLNSERIMAGPRIDNLSADFIFTENEFFYNLYAEIDTALKTSVDGNFKLGFDREQLIVNELYVDYKDIEWENGAPFTIDFYSDSIRINEMQIYHDTTSLLVDGTISRTESQQLNITLSKLPGNILGYYLFDIYDKNFFADTDLTAVVEGNLLRPRLNSEFNLKDIQFADMKLGNIDCKVNYNNAESNINLVFLDTLRNEQKPYITVKGSVPMYIGTDETYAEDNLREMDIQINADNFNLINLGQVVPTVSNQSGIFKSNIKISGQLDKPSFDGYVEIDRGKFISTLNNLEYLVDIRLLFDKSQMTIDNFKLANGANSKFKGAITGSGFLDFNFDNPAVELVLAGDIALLSKESRGANPNIYGDLYVSSDRPWRYSYSDNQSNFNGDFIIKTADITFIPARYGYTVSDDIVYNIKIDSSKIDRQRIKFEKLAKNVDNDQINQGNRFLENFSFDTNLRIERSARLVFLLSRTLNQRLTVEVDGSLNYSTIDNEPIAQGEFNLLPGSKLDFFKSLDAQGAIRFESDITDPFIDVVAVYQADYYYPGTEEVVPTAVKIKIESTAQNLDKYLNESNDNVQVYSGTRNIENNIPDNRYEATDAITFILVGKFPSDLSTGEKSSLTQNFALDAAGSVLGNALTSVLNSQVGDLVNDVRFSSSDVQTTVSVSGRIEDFRYSIGGTTSEGKDLSDISFADMDVKIEYPVTNRLMLRVERKNSVIQKTSSSNDQKINEFGLKYLFVF